MKYRYILFDLDGTVIESAAGIRFSLESAIKSLACFMPNLDDYTRYIGPPIIDTFLHLVGLDWETAKKGVELYRSYYSQYGKYLNRTYEGIPDLLQKLKMQNAKFAICTSKYEQFAEEILDILHIRHLFDAVCGSNWDGSRKEKKDLIPYAVQSLDGDLAHDSAEVVMLGDTWFDAQGARLCGVDFIGITYGYGTVDSMRAQGASVFAATPCALFDLL